MPNSVCESIRSKQNWILWFSWNSCLFYIAETLVYDNKSGSSIYLTERATFVLSTEAKPCTAMIAYTYKGTVYINIEVIQMSLVCTSMLLVKEIICNCTSVMIRCFVCALLISRQTNFIWHYFLILYFGFLPCFR